MMDLPDYIKHEANSLTTLYNGRANHHQNSFPFQPLSHFYFQPFVKQEEKYRNGWCDEENASLRTTFPNLMRPQMYMKKEESPIIPNELTHFTSQGEDAVVPPYHILDDVHPLWPRQMKRELQNKEQDCEQKSAVVDCSFDIAIKKETIEGDTEDCDFMKEEVNEMNMSEDEDDAAEMNEHKSALFNNTVVKTDSVELPQNVPDTDMSEHESMSDVGETSDQQLTRNEDNRQQNTPQKNIKNLYYTDETGHTCSVCGKVFSDSQTCLLHIWHKHTGEKPYVCELCGKAFKRMYDLKCHERCHSNERPYICDMCDKTFKLKSQLSRHKETCHSNARPHDCDLCEKTFKLRAHLQRHKETRHSDERPYPCDECDKTFKRKCYLVQHKATCHSDERPYTCEVCGKPFSQRNKMRQHEESHSSENHHSCDICGKTFKLNFQLQKHKNTHHSNDRPYSCHLCKKTFKRKDHLVQHVAASHSNERPYSCDICGRAFKQQSHVVAHKRIHTRQMILWPGPFLFPQNPCLQIYENECILPHNTE